MDPIIEFDHVTKEYKLYSGNRQRLASVFFKVNIKKKKAIDDVSFKIYKGESVAFIGKNGAGKSTILKMVTSVCFPTSGTITVNGRVSALLELTAGFDPEFTGRENIFLKGATMGLQKDEIKSIEQEIIDFADIGEYIDQPVRAYSSGMKARLGFAINASIHPEILIVDEALSVGDTQFKEKCLKKVKSLMSDEDITLLLVTHQTNVAKQFCKRAIYIEKGKMLFDGDIDEAVDIYENKNSK
jgi:teichoic acid transport system ATP-binding protein